LNLIICWNHLKQISNLALKKVAQTFDGWKVNPCRRFVVKSRDCAAVQAGPLSNVRDAKFVATHEGGQMAANHDFGRVKN
jgi:hypothetical protein